MSEARHETVTEIASRILAVAKAAYEKVPKLMLPGQENPPPPLEWHVAFTAAQFAESLIRLAAVRKVQVDTISVVVKSIDPQPSIPVKKGFNATLERSIVEANRWLQVFNIQLAQEL